MDAALGCCAVPACSAGLACWAGLACGVNLHPLKLAGKGPLQFGKVATVSRGFLQRTDVQRILLTLVNGGNYPD